MVESSDNSTDKDLSGTKGGAQSGLILCWGSGQHGQNGHGIDKKNVSIDESDVLLTIPADTSYVLACGSSHTVCMSKDRVFTWGNGEDGQLGSSDLQCRYDPVQLSLPSQVIDDGLVGVTCGASHTILWTKGGSCYGFGSNSHNQLSLQNNSDGYAIDKQTTPVLLTAVQHKTVTQVTCGERHTLFLYSCGSVAAVGSNNHGQLGVGSRVDCQNPTVLQELSNVCLIACGDNHSLAVTDSGELFIWGYGKPIGYKYKDIVRPTKKVSHYTNLIQLDGGACHSLALTENGNVYSWGSGPEGQLGHGDEELFLSKPQKLSREYLPYKVCRISAGSFISVALSVEGLIYLWGKGSHVKPTKLDQSVIYRPLRLDCAKYRLSSISCGTWHVVGVTNDHPPDLEASLLHDQQHRRRSVPDETDDVENGTGFVKDNDSSYDYMEFDSHNSEDELDEISDDVAPVSTSTITNQDTNGSNLHQHNKAVSRRREKTTLAEFYALSPELEKPGIVVLGGGDNTNSEVFHKDTDKSESSNAEKLKPEERTEQDNSLKLPSISRIPSPIKNCMENHATPIASSREISSELPSVLTANTLSSVKDSKDANNNVHVESARSIQQLPHVVRTNGKSNEKRSNNREGTLFNFNAIASNDVVEQVSSEKTLKSKAWNPHRTPLFTNTFHKEEQTQQTLEKPKFIPDKVSPVHYGQKSIGFVNMSDIKITDPPSQPKSDKLNTVSERHSKLYNKEMAMRNEMISRHNTYIKKPTARYIQSKADEHGDAVGTPFKGFDTQVPQIAKVARKVNRRTQIISRTHNGFDLAKKDVSRRNYASVPELRSAPTVVGSSMFNRLPDLRRSAHNDLSRSMTKLDGLDIKSAEGSERPRRRVAFCPKTASSGITTTLKMEMNNNSGGGRTYEGQDVSSAEARWTIPSNEKAMDIWHTQHDGTDEDGSKQLYELSAVDFSRPGHTVPKSEYSKHQLDDTNQEGCTQQTVTLFDLNQNQETKVLTTDINVDCDPSLANEESSSQPNISHSTSDNSHSNAPCVVCGDKSSGKHYGQLTCEGCKSFFKRSVRRNLSYTCRGNRDCAIDPQHRNQCQYCRLRKCIKAGMRREAVQRGRINPTPSMEYPYQLHSAIPVDSSRLSACYLNSFISLLLRAEPYQISHMQSPSSMSPHLDGLFEFTARLFFAAIEWARNIQFFMELQLMDQVSLLRSCWAELFILNTSQCCPPLYLSSILAAVTTNSSEARYIPPFNPDIIRQVQDQIDRLAVMRVDTAEFSCLKAIVLFSPDVVGLQDPVAVQNLQEKAQSSLDEYDKIQYGSQPNRSGRLLLRLPALKTINPATIESIFFTRLVGKTPIDTLIRDMLVGGHNFCWPPTVEPGISIGTSHSASL